MSNLARIEDRTPRSVVPDTHDADLDNARPEKTKIRSAWISFTSRILAQLIGAAATIGLGVIVMQQYAPVPATAGPATAALSVPARAAVPTPVPAAVSAPHDRPVIAVLPFINMSPQRQHDALADAIAEAAIAALSVDDGLRVISRTSSMRYKQTMLSLPAIGRQLNADFIVEGSIVVERGTARVIAQLIDVNTDQHVWARTYDRPIRDSLSLQQQIAAAIATDIVRAVQMPER